MLSTGRMLFSGLTCFLFIFLAGAGSFAEGAEKKAKVKGRRAATVLYQAKATATAGQKAALAGVLKKFAIKTDKKLLKGKVLRAKAAAQGLSTEEAICQELVATGAVDFAEPDYLIAPVVIPNDPNYSSQWHHPKINAPAAWDKTTGSAQVLVAVCDTGVDSDHPDLVANLQLPGYNSADGSTNSEDGQGHGTQTAGTIGAVGNNGIGVAGVAWNVKLLPVRITNRGDGAAYLSDMADGIRWAADQGAKVANLSYGGASSPTIDAAALYLRAKGGLLFMSAGNDGADHPTYPDFTSFVCVGATTSADAKASWSSYGTYVDLVAPGVSIWTTANGGGYSSPSGTSFSSPCAAGVGALIFSINPDFTPTQVESVLFSTCKDLGAAGDDGVYGFGRVNAAAAVAKALNVAANQSPVAVAGATPTTGIAPVTVQFDGSGSSDVGGSILFYRWNFGDGSYASGVTVGHTYSSIGSYTATLTVTDDMGASHSASVTITATTDPTVINAPSDLTASVAGATVTLTWTDNSDNEEGFYVERGVKQRGRITFTLAGQVGAGTTTFSEDVADGTYRYRVQAFNLTSGKVSDYSNEVQAQTGSTKKGGGGGGGGGGKGKKPKSAGVEVF